MVFSSFNKIALKEHIICRVIELVDSVGLRNDYEEKWLCVVNTVNRGHCIKINHCIKDNPVLSIP